MTAANYAFGKNSPILFPITSTVPGTYYSPDQVNHHHRGVVLSGKVTTDNTTGTLVLTIQGKDPTSGDYYDILSTTALNVAAGLKTLKVYPGITAAANASASDVLPPVWRVKAVVAAANVVASVGAGLIL